MKCTIKHVKLYQYWTIQVYRIQMYYSLHSLFPSYSGDVIVRKQTWGTTRSFASEWQPFAKWLTVVVAVTRPRMELCRHWLRIRERFSTRHAGFRFPIKLAFSWYVTTKFQTPQDSSDPHLDNPCKGPEAISFPNRDAEHPLHSDDRPASQALWHTAPQGGQSQGQQPREDGRKRYEPTVCGMCHFGMCLWTGA
jgi:hypothetical protein